MKADRFQSFCATLLLTGCLLVAAGGLGLWYFGPKSPKSTEEKQELVSKEPEQTLQQTPAENETPPSEAINTPSPTPAPPEPSATPKAQVAQPQPSQPPPRYVLVGSTVVPAPSTGPVPKAKSTPLLITSAAGSPSPSPSPSAVTPAAAASWTLSNKQRQQIADALGKEGGKNITICSVQSDAAGLAFATALKHLFEQAGWHVDGVKQLPFAKPPVGLSLVSGSYPAPDALVAAYHALVAAGLNVSQQLDMKLSGSQVELIVGGKPAE